MEESEEEQYNKKLRKRVAEAVKAAQLEERKKEILKQFLDPKAYERVMNVRASNHDLYNQLVSLIVSLAQSNRVSGKITDEQIMSILQKLTYKPEPKIEFKRK